MPSLRRVLEQLRDPFVMYPLHSAIGAVANAISQEEGDLYSRMEPSGRSRKYYTVVEEHHLEVISVLLGAAFVIAQATVTQVVALAQKAHWLAQKPAWLLNDKAALMRFGSNLNTKTGESEIAVVNALANYFKHHEEWPDNWELSSATRLQVWNINIVRKLGLSPNNSDNLHLAASALGFQGKQIRCLMKNTERWKNKVTDELIIKLRQHDLVSAEDFPPNQDNQDLSDTSDLPF